MNSRFHLGCAGAALLIGLLTVLPPVVVPEEDVLPLLDDTDPQKSLARPGAHDLVAALPAPPPRPAGPDPGAPVAAIARRAQKEPSSDREFLSRAPPSV